MFFKGGVVRAISLVKLY